MSNLRRWHGNARHNMHDMSNITLPSYIMHLGGRGEYDWSTVSEYSSEELYVTSKKSASNGCPEAEYDR